MNQIVELQDGLISQCFEKGDFSDAFDFVENMVGKDVVYDMDKAADRKEAASVAYAVVRSKTAINKVGTQIIKGERDKFKKKEADIKSKMEVVQATLGTMAEKIRKPLTEWEEVRKAVDADIEAIKKIGLTVYGSPEQAVAALEKLVNFELRAASIVADKMYDYSSACEDAHASVDDQLGTLVQREEDAKELAELRAKQAEAERQDAAMDREAIGYEEPLDLTQEEPPAEEEPPAAASMIHPRPGGTVKVGRSRAATINNEAMNTLVEACGIDEALAKKVIVAIIQKKVAHVTISY